MKAENARLRENVAILRAATFFVGGTRPPQPLIAGFIDTMRSEGHAVESICRVLSEQVCQVAARTYRAWKTRAPSARMLSDARVVETIEQVAYRLDAQGRRRLAPEGLYGRRKMLACLRCRGVSATPGAVDRVWVTDIQLRPLVGRVR